MHQVKPEEILKALERGPLTFNLLVVAIGYEILSIRQWSRWRRFWRRSRVDEANCNAENIRRLLNDMQVAGQIVLIGKDHSYGLWALPDLCPACNGSGKQANHPYRDGLKVVR